MKKKVPSNLQLQQYRAQLKRFVEFTDEQWTVFTEKLYLKTVKKKEFLIAAGKTCSEVGFILAGSFRFFFVKDGVEISNYFCFQNELISSYPSFIKRQPGGVSIDAMEDAELICFNYDSLQELLKDQRIAFTM